MDRKKFIYKLRSNGYTYRRIGELLNISKQYVYILYSTWERWHEDYLDKICALCNEHKKNVTKHHKIPFCPKCWKIAKEVKNRKYERGYGFNKKTNKSNKKS